MIRSWHDERKRKSIEKEESWMKTLIIFLAKSSEDVSDEPIIIEDVMEGYLVRRIYMDQGASVEEIVTLVTRTVIISECRRLNKKQMIEKEAQQSPPLTKEEPREVGLTEEILVNPAYPE
ncbi:hypothetical protein Tco_1017970 [Tanacetum coccineum]|uniref:Uncharacterized protein n=1 Tax=Tanacetum coccineum TaxID=301880 RepID=A0ABQ5FT63_9ASTR